MSRRNFFRILFAGILAFLAGFTLAPSAHALGGQLPPIGEPAPEFTLPTNIGEGEISLSDYRGEWVVLYFYPKDNIHFQCQHCRVSISTRPPQFSILPAR
jgi:peroxiredoxin Q/BCP